MARLRAVAVRLIEAEASSPAVRRAVAGVGGAALAVAVEFLRAQGVL